MATFKFLWFFWSCILSCLTILHGEAQQQQDSPVGTLSQRTGLLLKDNVVVRLIQTSSGDRSFDYVSQLALWHREQATEGFTRAAEWVLQKASEFGLEQVNIERFPCDGKIEYFGQVMDPQWKVKKAELWLTSPFPIKLTSYDELPMCLAFASTSSDTEAELIDIGSGTKDENYAPGVRGKIVLTTSRPADIFERAVNRQGAAGIISSWSVPYFDLFNRRTGDFPDQVGWTSIPGNGAGEKGHFAFLISSRQADDLRTLMNQGKILRINAVVDAELVPGNLEVVSGIIPGSTYPNEEIIVTAHLDHYKPGANDNASGSAAILEMAGTLKELIKSGALPRPLRTIRFMWVPEYNGTYAWLSKHINDPVKRIADLNFDMVGENILKTNSILSQNYTSDSNPSFLNAILESIVDFANSFNGERYPMQPDMYIGSLKGSRNRLECRMQPYTTGTDHELFNNLKIPASTLGAWPDNFYHSSEDTPDKVDPTQLHRAVVIGLAAITTLSYCDDGQAGDLAQLSLIYGRKRIANAEFSAVRSILTAGKDNFADADHSAGFLITHDYTREKEAIGSSAIFAHTSTASDEVRKVVAVLSREEPVSHKKVEDAAIFKAHELGISRSKIVLSESEKLAGHLIPIPKKGKELFNLSYVSRILEKDTTARIPEIMKAMSETTDRLLAQGESELRIFGFQDAPAFYSDGKRSILEIGDAIAAEYTPLPVKILELYFRAFEKAGLIELMQK